MNIYSFLEHGAGIPWVLQASVLAIAILGVTVLAVRRSLAASNGGVIPDEGVTVRNMVEIVVESEAPHAVVVYQIPDDVLEYGRDEYRRLISILDECEQAKSWPGPCETEQVLTLPSWVYGSEDDLTDLGLEAA